MWAIVCGFSLVSLVSWYITMVFGLTLAYGDALSHLDIARFVFDGRQTGIAQLGTVWLPLSHILYLPFVWNTWLWHTGLAGSLISMAAFVTATVFTYKIVTELVGSRIAGMLGALAYAMNLNILYLQSTPLTESLYLMTLILSVYFLIRYLKTADTKYLLPLGLFTSAQVLSRYDGWFVAFVEIVIVLIFELWVRREAPSRGLGNVILFATPVVFSALLWLGWNLVLFGNPLYFLTGPYSAHSQQVVLAARSQLPTKFNVFYSTKVFSYAVVANIGVLVILAGSAGWIKYLMYNRKLRLALRMMICITLFAVIVFNILSLILGFSIISLPELHVGNTALTSADWFNTRYGIVGLPFFAVGVGLLYGRQRWQAILIGLLLALQAGLLYQSGIVTVQEGTLGWSAFTYQKTATTLGRDAKSNQSILLSASGYGGIAFKSGLPLRQFIYEGDSKIWNDALAHPDKYVTWIVMSNGDSSDPVYNALVVEQKSSFLSQYRLIETDVHARLYERISKP